jgi:hypothetical protein
MTHVETVNVDLVHVFDLVTATIYVPILNVELAQEDF